MLTRYLFFQKIWKSEITYSQNFKFVDEMIIGSCDKWIYTHIFVELSAIEIKVMTVDFELLFYLRVVLRINVF